MHQSIIVHGPPECGKTWNSIAIARHFGLSRILDDQDPFNLPTGISTDTLILTRVNLRGRAEVASCRVIAYEDAAFEAGVSNPVNQSDQE